MMVEDFIEESVNGEMKTNQENQEEETNRFSKFDDTSSAAFIK